MRSSDFRRVSALAYDGLCLFELGIVVEIFGRPRPELDVDWYKFEICSLERGPLHAMGGVRVEATRGLNSLQRAGTIVIPGWRDASEPPPEPLLKALRSAHARGARLVSICSGVFVLAAAGLLDGKRVTTHWRDAKQLAAQFPKLRVDADVLFVDEGSILTSAGSAAGIDLCLHIVRRDYGAEIANRVARRLVMPPHRDGGQAQYVQDPLGKQSPGKMASLLQWAQSHLDQPLRVEDLARRAAMSPRTFARQFRRQTGTTPHQWLTHERLVAAQRRLEKTNDGIDQVAEAVGMHSAATLRQHFSRTLDTTPTAYRRRFSTKRR